MLLMVEASASPCCAGPQEMMILETARRESQSLGALPDQRLEVIRKSRDETVVDSGR